MASSDDIALEKVFTLWRAGARAELLLDPDRADCLACGREISRRSPKRPWDHDADSGCGDLSPDFADLPTGPGAPVVFAPSVTVSLAAGDRDPHVGRRVGEERIERGAVYPMLDLSHEPGSWFPEGITEVTCRLSSVGQVAFEAVYTFYVCVGVDPDAAPPPKLKVLSGRFPWDEALPGNRFARSLNRKASREVLRRLVTRGAAARDETFPRSTDRFVRSAAGKITGITGDAALEQSEAYLEGQFRIAAAGKRFASPQRPAASWTMYVFRNVTRDMRRAEERLDGRPNDVLSAAKLIAYYGSTTPAEAAARHGLLTRVKDLQSENPGVPYAEIEKIAEAEGPHESTIPMAVWEEAFRGRMIAGSLDQVVGDDLTAGDLIAGEDDALTVGHPAAVAALEGLLAGRGVGVDDVLPWLVREGAVVTDPDADTPRLGAAYAAAKAFFEPFARRNEEWRRLEDRARIQERARKAFRGVDLGDTEEVAAVWRRAAWRTAVDEGRAPAAAAAPADDPFARILDDCGVAEADLGAWLKALGADPAPFGIAAGNLEGQLLAEVGFRIVRAMQLPGETWADKNTKLRIVGKIVDAAVARKAAAEKAEAEKAEAEKAEAKAS